LVGGVAVAGLGGPKFEVTGIRPNLSLENQRGDAMIAIAGLGVFMLFAVIAGGVIAQ
jgi:hypothetical protein